MATVAQLVNLICEDLGLDDDASSTDRVKALSALNEAYDELCQRALRRHTTVDHTPSAGVTAVDLSTVTTLKDHFLALDRICVVNGTDVSKPILRVGTEDLFDSRVTERGAPGSYAYAWPYVYLNCPMDGAMSLRIAYICSALELVESGAGAGQEESPSAIQPGWQKRLLAGLAKVKLLEGYEGREQDAAYHRGLVEQALTDYLQMQSREGGKTMPRDPWAVRRFDTPDTRRMR